MQQIYTLENVTATGATIVEFTSNGNKEVTTKTTLPKAEAISQLEDILADWQTKDDGLADRITYLQDMQTKIGTILTDLQDHIATLEG